MRCVWLNNDDYESAPCDAFGCMGKMCVGDLMLAYPMEARYASGSTYRGKKTTYHIVPLHMILYDGIYEQLKHTDASTLNQVGVAYDGELEDVF